MQIMRLNKRSHQTQNHTKILGDSIKIDHRLILNVFNEIAMPCSFHQNSLFHSVKKLTERGQTYTQTHTRIFPLIDCIGLSADSF